MLLSFFKDYSPTNFMKQDLFKKQYEKVKIVYSIEEEILILV